jgi:hypothetical protein
MCAGQNLSKCDGVREEGDEMVAHERGGHAREEGGEIIMSGLGFKWWPRS